MQAWRRWSARRSEKPEEIVRFDPLALKHGGVSLLVPEKLRNVICPWQTEREIRSQTKTVEKMLKALKLEPEEERKLLRLDRPDRTWTPKGV